MDRSEFDSVVQDSFLNTLRVLGQESLDSVTSLMRRGDYGDHENLISRLGEIDAILDELFAKFSILIKHITILEACSRLKVDPPKLGNSLLWMVEELRSNLWGVRT